MPSLGAFRRFKALNFLHSTSHYLICIGNKRSIVRVYIYDAC